MQKSVILPNKVDVAVVYSRTTTTCTNEYIGAYTTYGILGAKGDVTITAIEDVSRDSKWVDDFILCLNRLEVAPEHLHDVIGDCLP